MLRYLVFFSFILLVWSAKSIDSHFPQQVHLALGTDETEIVVTWATIKHLKDDHHGHVLYGVDPNRLNIDIKAKATSFKDRLYTYRALLTGLKPSTTYYYKVGTNQTAYTKEFHFKTLPSGNNWCPRIALYGDLGYKNDQSLPYLTKDVEKEIYDVLFHIGDFAYDLHDKDGEVGNDFMNSIEPVAANVPYMAIPGNHEHFSNFSEFDSRFSMIGDRHDPKHEANLADRINNHFWTADIGPAHILMFNTEYYTYTEFGWEQIERQFRFLEEDLIRANANRQERPWIIVMGHKPFYCLKEDDSDCLKDSMERPELRQGIQIKGKGPKVFGLEDLFYKYGVDIQFYGHEHYYGRLLPVYNGKVLNGTNPANPYYHPEGPVHIITGSAGNSEKHPMFSHHPKEFVGFHTNDYGYTRLTFKDQYHIQIEQVSDDQLGKVVDQIEIIKHDMQPKWMANL